MHYRAIKIVFKFQRFIAKNPEAVAIRMKSLQYLAWEIYKEKNRLSSITMMKFLLCKTTTSINEEVVYIRQVDIH